MTRTLLASLAIAALLALTAKPVPAGDRPTESLSLSFSKIEHANQQGGSLSGQRRPAGASPSSPSTSLGARQGGRGVQTVYPKVYVREVPSGPVPRR